MKLRRIMCLFLCIVLTLACSSFVYGATVPVVKLSISVGQGQTKDLTNYLKSDSGTIKWTTTNSAVATVSGKTVKGVKVGSAILKGTSAKATYQITVKVLADYSAPETLDVTTTKNNTITNSKGEKITYKDYYLTMGVNDTVDVSGIIKSNTTYSNYRWNISNEKCLTFKQGKLTSKAEGVVKVTAVPSKEKNTIYRYFITIDSNFVAKNITLSKNKLTPLANYVGDSPENYVYEVKSINGSAASIDKNTYIKTGNSVGSCIVKAESTNGKSSYCFIIKTR